MKIAIIIFTVLATLICICACQLAPLTAPTDPTQTTTMPTEPPESTAPPTQPTEPDPRIAELEALLSWSGQESFYNAALLSEYATPADVDLCRLFYDGFRGESQKPTDEELVLLEGKMGQYWKEMDLFRLPVEKMDAVLTRLFGITLEETNGIGLDRLVYLEETNCYYTAHTGPDGIEKLQVNYIETLDDGSLMVQYTAPYYGDFMVKLMPAEDGGYRILSNAAITGIYNKQTIRNVTNTYFAQREDYLLGKSQTINNTNPGIVPDEAKHLEAIQDAGIDWLQSEISIGEVGCWDSHAEALVTEEISYRKDGIVYKETIEHKLQLGLIDDGSIVVVCDGYIEKASNFKSCSYVPDTLPTA